MLPAQILQEQVFPGNKNPELGDSPGLSARLGVLDRMASSMLR